MIEDDDGKDDSESTPLEKIDTTNDFLVGLHAGLHDDSIAILRALPGSIPKDKALRLAAWIVALVDDDNEFPEILKAVQTT